MLLSLHVKNLALIQETEVEFGPGLNVLTGETGAGKSILLGSINLALGAKAEKELIRNGAEYALVELSFQDTRDEIRHKMEELDLSLDEDGLIVISRKIQENRSVCKINGETVSARICKELAEQLIDIHGQHEHQSLLQIKNHRKYLDAFCELEVAELLTQLEKEYRNLHELERELQEEDMDEETRKRELSLAEFEYAQIMDAGLVVGEDASLEHDFRKMEHYKKLQESVAIAHQLLGYDMEDGAGNQTGRALRELKSVVGYDEGLNEGVSMLMDIDSLMNDLNRFLSGYLDEIVFDEETFQNCESRLNLINQLRSRYGNTIEEILNYAVSRENKINELNDYDVYREGLQKKCDVQRERVHSLCAKISEIRKKNAPMLAERLKQALIDLNFLNVEFEVEVRSNPEKISACGYDEVEFLISTNPGEPLRSLGKIASGGELSRVMLAIKTLFADKDNIETLVFDEIDSGISGKTAWMVSRKMGELGKNHQLLCISHLPQIAANAQTHFLIEKKTDGVSTITTLSRLSEEESIAELARMLGGESLTDVVLNNAREMRKQAKNHK